MRTRLTPHPRLNRSGALVISPRGRRLRVRTASSPQNLAGEPIVQCLPGLLTDLTGPRVLLWDSAPIHPRHMVPAFIAAQRRLQAFSFPNYAPELTSVEFLWTQGREHLACRA